MTDLQIDREWTRVLVSAVCDLCDGRTRIGDIGSLGGVCCPRCRGAGRVLRFEWRRRADLEALEAAERSGQG